MYHKVDRRPFGARIKGLYVNPRLFAAQMAELAQAGFSSPALASVLAQTSNRQKYIAITFDDGFRSVFDHALPILKHHGLRGMVYLLPPLLGHTNEWDLPAGEKTAPLMDATQVREWLASGHEIGSHGLTHSSLVQLPDPKARAEIGDSKKMLEDKFGIPIQHFCYPYGDYNDNVKNWVAEAGYLTACTTRFGLNSNLTHPLELHRITVRYPSRKISTLWKSLTAGKKNQSHSP